MLHLPSPLIKARGLSSRYGKDIWLKLETLHPTGCHKDRESLAIIEACKRQRIKKVGCTSTGNFAISLAFFSHVYDIECHVWVKDSDNNITKFLECFGAKIHRMDGTFSEIYGLSNSVMGNMKIFNANPGKCQEKIFANREIGVEIQTQNPNVDTVICALNNGSHFIGVDSGLSNVKMIGVYSHCKLAPSIYGFSKEEGEKDIVKVGGLLIEAYENDLRVGVRQLLKEGVIAQTASAATVGIIDRLDLSTSKTICCVITGTALKYPRELLSAVTGLK